MRAAVERNPLLRVSNWYASLEAEEKRGYIKKQSENRKRKRDLCETSKCKRLKNSQQPLNRKRPGSSPASSTRIVENHMMVETRDSNVTANLKGRKQLQNSNWYVNLNAEEKRMYIQKQSENRKCKRYLADMSRNEQPQPYQQQLSSSTPQQSRNRLRSSKAWSAPIINTEMMFPRREYELSPYHRLRQVDKCSFCEAERYEYEPPNFCCSGGEIVLSSPDAPQPLWMLFTEQSDEAIEFRKHIRAYNSMFAFTSFGVKLDHEIASSRRGVYTFRAQGQIYHDLPSLVPSSNSPCYFQMYFYDTENEVQNRMNVIPNADLSEVVIKKLMDILAENPYILTLRRLEHGSLDTYRIHIRSDAKLDQRVYNAPSADQVAAIWIEGNNPCTPHERDIVVHSTSGQKHRVRHYYGCYDPLQYPILFPRGEVGWHQKIPKNKREKNTRDIVNAVGAAQVLDTPHHDEYPFQKEAEASNDAGQQHINAYNDEFRQQSGNQIEPISLFATEQHDVRAHQQQIITHDDHDCLNEVLTTPTDADDIFQREQQGVRKQSQSSVSCREYYCYKLQVRRNRHSVLLLAGRLLQQFVVDMYIKLENTRLDFYRQRQSTIRADLYQGIVDSVLHGQTRGYMVGKRVVLPASFIGGPRDMRRRYLDAIALVQRFGKPDLFITKTCNPEWEEIKESLREGELAQDRPDITSRVFRAKLQDLKNLLFKECIFGQVAAHVHVIEFQKRGLPHAHILVILKSESKISTTEQIDKFVSAEIPDPKKYPELHAMVVKHMLHGPCGHLNQKNACMRDGKCKNKYPKQFSEETTQGEDSYAIYRRTKNSVTVNVRSAELDNRWVVPYNPYLLSRYNCHINVEICSSVKAVKYLYKYIYKGHDKVAISIYGNDQVVVDEIEQFQQARWVSPPEAMWRIFGFDLNEIYPAVINLQLHLPNKQFVSYWAHQNLEDFVCSATAKKTTLTEFFEFCKNDDQNRQFLYREFPEKFVWNKNGRFWSERKFGTVIGRINGANPNEGERYFLRLLLNHVKSPTCFEDLLNYNGMQCLSFKKAAELRGLFQSDNWISDSLTEAATFQMPLTLRHLFATILVHCEPGDVRKLWEDHFESMSEDFAKTDNCGADIRLAKTVKSIGFFLECMGRDIKDYDLPSTDVDLDESTSMRREILDELSIQTPPEDLGLPNSLNHDQQAAYNIILDHVNANRSGIFFIDGPGGTGKTFLYRALLAEIRSRGMIAIATATSGVAASILPGGRTAHSRFKIPIDANDTTVCNIPKQGAIAELLRASKIIVWDEAPMAKRVVIETLDRSMRDIMGNSELFGGKVVVFGGDFRQVLPVVPRGTRAETVNASLVMSYLWPEMQRLKLSKNMRAQSDSTFSDLLLRIGDGEEASNCEGKVKIPEQMAIYCNGNGSCEDQLINTIFPNLKENVSSPGYITDRAILSTKNEFVDMLNEKLIHLFPGREWKYHSYDKAVDDTHNYYPEEFLNSLTPNGLPPHELVLKLNSPIMLLRNINPSDGLCNGTRMVCKGFERNVIRAEITLGQHAGKQVFIPRIPMLPAENEGYPFKFKRTQFPIRLCFAMTINKSQGQTIPYVGVYLPQPVFSHGQLYVALSRGTSMSTTKVLVKADNQEKDAVRTKNIVYREVLTS